MAQIELRMGVYARVDDDDLEWLFHYTWRFSGGQAQTSIRRPDGSQTVIAMHRLMLRHRKGQVVYRLDGDQLNLRRSKLRVGRRISPQQPFGLLRETGDLA